MSERSESNVGLTDLLARVAWHMRMKYRVEMKVTRLSTDCCA